MKRFSLLSGAYVNAGDFLIVERTKKILEYLYPGCKVVEYKRNGDLAPYLSEINKADAVIIAGGPAYKPNIYPEEIKLVDNLDKIKTKIVPVGLGWYGKNVEKKVLEQYKFSRRTIEFLRRMENDAKGLSCRGNYTQAVLKRNGFKKSVMTGCPAWYDLENIGRIGLRRGIKLPNSGGGSEKMRICLSEPSDAVNYREFVEVVKYVGDRFRGADVLVVLHRIDKMRMDKRTEKMIRALREMEDVKVKDISYGVKGFSVYDDCDLHIGYRVHAHLYNLSKRNFSILIEEDGRGAEANETLGLPDVQSAAYRANKYVGEERWRRLVTKAQRGKANYMGGFDKSAIRRVDEILRKEENEDYEDYRKCFRFMKANFKVLKKYIKESVG